MIASVLVGVRSTLKTDPQPVSLGEVLQILDILQCVPVSLILLCGFRDQSHLRPASRIIPPPVDGRIKMSEEMFVA